MTKNILVLGAGKGIGKAVADLAYSKGHKITAVSRSKTDLLNRPYSTLTSNLDLLQSVSELGSYASTVDAIINCTGTHPGFDHPAIDENIMYTINQNIIPALHLYGAFLDKFRKIGKGHFVHISSGALDFFDPSEAGYCASKAALEALVTSIQNGDREQGILHHAARVSLTDTPLARKVCPSITDWNQFYTPEETARCLIDIVEYPEKYPDPIVKLPLKPIR